MSVGAVRHRGDVWAKRTRDEIVDPDSSRVVRWDWFDEGRRFGLRAELPAAEGAIVARAIERVAAGIPAMPGETGPIGEEARRADALVALCSGAATVQRRRPTLPGGP